MKTNKFLKELNDLFNEDNHLQVTFESFWSGLFLEASVTTFIDTPFNPRDAGQKTFFFIIALEDRYGIKELNMNSVPKEFRAEAFDLIVEYASTSTDRR